jgi:hypothetical protein
LTICKEEVPMAPDEIEWRPARAACETDSSVSKR